MHIARVGERLPRLQIQFRISRSFRPRNLANLRSKIRFGFAERNTPKVFGSESSAIADVYYSLMCDHTECEYHAGGG